MNPALETTSSPPIQMRKSTLTQYIIIVVILFVLPFLVPEYLHSMLSKIYIFAIFAMGLNLVLGYTGLISLGHAAYLGVGGYTVGIFMTYFGIDGLVVKHKRPLECLRPPQLFAIRAPAGERPRADKTLTRHHMVVAGLQQDVMFRGVAETRVVFDRPMPKHIARLQVKGINSVGLGNLVPATSHGCLQIGRQHVQTERFAAANGDGAVLVSL